MRAIKLAAVFMSCHLCLCSIAMAVEPKDLVGSFKSKVTEPDGSKYEGTCEITHSTRRTLQLVWHYGKKTSVGIGKLKDDILTVEYEGAIANREGTARYEIKSADRLAGKFKRKGTKGTGTELLIRE